MRIGITFDLKTAGPPSPLPLPPAGRGENNSPLPAGERGRGEGEAAPDDSQEEYDSPATIAAIAAALRDLGHDVEQLGDGRELLGQLLARPPELVFNIAEGQGTSRSREARVPAVLEMLGIPYTGSDPLTLAATLDKDCAKRLVRSVGVPVPAGVVVGPRDDPRRVLRDGDLPFPVLVKPAWEGSSKGIRHRCLVDRPEEVPEVVESLRRDHRQPVLVEEFIAGEELTVGVIGNAPPRVLGIMHVLPKERTDRFVYSLEVKRDWERQVRYECPPRLPAAEVRAVEEAALAAYAVLGCRDVSRVDFRLRGGVPYFLEVNPLPGLNPEASDLVFIARHVGWTYGGLIEAILRAALERQGPAAEEERRIANCKMQITN